MIVLLPFAFLSGIVTILSPCILPVLPLVLSGSVGGKGRPFGVIAGFVASFSVFTLILSSLVQALNISPDALRVAAVVFVLFFGLVMLVRRLRHAFEMVASRMARSGSQGQSQSSGFVGGVLVGLSLGLIWTPCVGPIMASVISLAVTQSVDGGAVSIILAYSLGTSIPMLAIMLGGRRLVNRVPLLARSPDKVQRVFGVLMIVVAVSVGLGWDRTFQAAVLSIFPNYGSGLTGFESTTAVRDALSARSESLSGGIMTSGSAPIKFEPAPQDGQLADLGAAPELVTSGEWFNIDALGDVAQDGVITMDDLRGKVVLVDFWTYSCVNCIRTLPHLRSWYEAYGDDGFVIIGVHTPEFAFERGSDNVRRAIEELGVNWPVVLDNDYVQWRAYDNRYWPAHYFIDAVGQVRYFHFGEGEYDTSEKVIRALLEEAGRLSTDRALATPEMNLKSRTAETYLGYGRALSLRSDVNPVNDEPVLYRPVERLGNGEWTLSGRWTITSEYIVPQNSGSLELSFRAQDVYLVIEPTGRADRIEVHVDGKAVRDTADVRNGTLVPNGSRLYHLLHQSESGSHVLRLDVRGELRLFAFTFG